MKAYEAARKKGKQEARPRTLAERLREDPARVMSEAGMSPDPWQAEVLRSRSPRILLNCSRQSGKSQVAGGLLLHRALTSPGSLILLVSRAERQSKELLQEKVLPLFRALPDAPAAAKTNELELVLSNRSRIIALPGKEESIRSFSAVNLIVIDEAARVPDALYRSVRPMLAVAGGRLMALSTPAGKRGWFYDEWRGEGGDADRWARWEVPAAQCPRIPAGFLEEERVALGDRWWRQEYLCSFEELIDSVFSAEDIEAAMSDEVLPLFGGGGP